jgi:hypothetical protein
MRHREDSVDSDSKEVNSYLFVPKQQHIKKRVIQLSSNLSRKKNTARLVEPDEGYEGDVSPCLEFKVRKRIVVKKKSTTDNLKVSSFPSIPSAQPIPSDQPISSLSSMSIFKKLRVDIPKKTPVISLGAQPRKIKQVVKKKEKTLVKKSVISCENGALPINTHAHCPRTGDSFDYFNKILAQGKKTLFYTDKDVRVADSLSRLLSIKASRCCAVSILKKDQLRTDSTLYKEMTESSKLIISYNSPHQVHYNIGNFERYAQNKLELIRQFICEYNQIRINAKKEYKSHGDLGRYKSEVDGKIFFTAKKTVLAIMDKKNGGCGELGKKTRDEKTKRLVTDLLKVVKRAALPKLQEFLLYPTKQYEMKRHAEQNIMEHYKSIADDLNPGQRIPIGCERLHCFNCTATKIFFYNTDLRFEGRGCNPTQFPNVYNFVEDMHEEKQNCRDCVYFFQTGKKRLELMGKGMAPVVGGGTFKERVKNAYPSDSDSDLDSILAKTPTLTPTY